MGEDGGQRRGEAATARVLDGPDVVDPAVAVEVEGERGGQALAVVTARDHDAVGVGVDAGHETRPHVEALQEAGAEVVGVAVIADRNTGAAESIEATGLGYRYAYGLEELGLANS